MSEQKQEVPLELWEEFEKEMNKIESFDISKLKLGSEDKNNLNVFFKQYFLNPKENIPEGERHSIIEKNFAIYILANKISLEEIKEAYKSKGFKINSLLSQIKGVQKGTYGTEPKTNVGELVNWCKRNREDLVPLFKTKIIEEERDYEFYTHEQLRDYEPQPQGWLIENQIPKGEVGLLVGKRGERKTFFALYSALCLASGKKSFGVDNVPERKKVLIIDEETGINELSKRIKLLEKGLDIPQSEKLEIRYFSFEGIKIHDGNFKFYNILEEFKPDLILVDCLSRVVRFEVDKDNSSISDFFTGIVRPVIKKYGCSWLFIHHLRKSPPNNKKNSEDLLDEVRGGSELTNYCRFVLLTQLPKNLETKENTDLVIFRVLKMSNAPIPEPIVISFETTQDSIKVNYEGLPKDILTAEVRCATSIKEYLFENQITEFQTKELTEAWEEIGAKKTLISYGLNFLLNQKFLEKVKRGFWRVAGDTNQTKLWGAKK